MLVLPALPRDSSLYHNVVFLHNIIEIKYSGRNAGVFAVKIHRCPTVNDELASKPGLSDPRIPRSCDSLTTATPGNPTTRLPYHTSIHQSLVSVRVYTADFGSHADCLICLGDYSH